MLFDKLFRRSAAREKAQELYLAVVEQARNPIFYARYGVPDTVDGRFDMVTLHVFLVLRRLRRDGHAGAELGQLLFDAMFDDMDRNLREMGVGDLGVGRRVKAMGKAFYGRAVAYDAGLDEGDSMLADALRRNLYGEAAEADHSAELATYMRAALARLDEQEGADLLAGRVDFGGIPGV